MRPGRHPSPPPPLWHIQTVIIASGRISRVWVAAAALALSCCPQNLPVSPPATRESQQQSREETTSSTGVRMPVCVCAPFTAHTVVTNRLGPRPLARAMSPSPSPLLGWPARSRLRPNNRVSGAPLHLRALRKDSGKWESSFPAFPRPSRYD